jgi:NAD(P)-dependent dehydrogenase (short-subunit alcohol dehydrogenase family)
MPTLSQHHKTAFITGASSGIGRAVAEMLLAGGARVWGTSREVSRLAALEGRFPGTFTPVALDLGNPAAAQAAFERGAEAAGVFDIVINNAGYGGAFSPFAGDDFAPWQRQVDAMLATTARLAHTALRGMIARNRGCLVNVSSLVVNFPLPHMSAYNTAKAGLSALSESLIFETRGTGVAVVDFRPGDYRTAFNDAIRANQPGRAEWSDRTGRIWRAIDNQFSTSPLPERAARDLIRAIARGRSGTVCSGTFFQARLAPLAARLLPTTLMRSLQARYFGAT